MLFIYLASQRISLTRGVVGQIPSKGSKFPRPAPHLIYSAPRLLWNNWRTAEQARGKGSVQASQKQGQRPAVLSCLFSLNKTTSI